MFKTRRRRLAWLFALVLLSELAVLCCASTHLSSHLCPGCEQCAICACVRSGLNRAAVAPLALLVLLALAALDGESPARRGPAPFFTLFARKVRLND